MRQKGRGGTRRAQLVVNTSGGDCASMSAVNIKSCGLCHVRRYVQDESRQGDLDDKSNDFKDENSS